MSNKHNGFTIIELMITLVIAAVLAALAAPSFNTFMNNTRFSSASLQLISDLNHARSEAIKRNSRVLVCLRNTAGTDCAAGTDWRVGWVVCIDSDSDSLCDASTAADPNPQDVRPALAKTLTLTSAFNMIRFNPNGSAVASSLTLGGTWAGAVPRVITVAATGNISSQ
jgi:type IV fimbrial biogenesis protein FimT